MQNNSKKPHGIIVALAFADLHIHKFQAFNTPHNNRLYNSLLVLREIRVKANKLCVPVLFAGDLFHAPKEVENETMALTVRAFQETTGHFIAISGNHDMSEKNTSHHKSPTHLDSFSWCPGFEKIDLKYWGNDNIRVAGVPYYNNDYDTVEDIKMMGGYMDEDDDRLKILLLHTDIPGAKTPEGTTVGSNEFFPTKFEKKLFQPFDLVLCGHIHKPQQLGDKTYMLGSPIHQNAGDCGTEMGYWEIYSTGKIRFVPLNGYPKFVKDPNEFQQGDYMVVSNNKPEESNDVEVGEFDLSFSRDELVDRYMKAIKLKSKLKTRLLKKLLNSANS